MKRSASVRRILLGGFSAGAIASAAAAAEARVTPESYYTNDYHLPGAGYYHAPFREFYPQRYNHFDAGRKMYFYGGQWGPTPHRSIINISAPTDAAARNAEARRSDLIIPVPVGNVRRSGFGHDSRSHFGSSS